MNKISTRTEDISGYNYEEWYAALLAQYYFLKEFSSLLNDFEWWLGDIFAALFEKYGYSYAIEQLIIYSSTKEWNVADFLLELTKNSDLKYADNPASAEEDTIKFLWQLSNSYLWTRWEFNQESYRYISELLISYSNWMSDDKSKFPFEYSKSILEELWILDESRMLELWIIQVILEARENLSKYISEFLERKNSFISSCNEQLSLNKETLLLVSRMQTEAANVLTDILMSEFWTEEKQKKLDAENSNFIYMIEELQNLEI